MPVVGLTTNSPVWRVASFNSKRGISQSPTSVGAVPDRVKREALRADRLTVEVENDLPLVAFGQFRPMMQCGAGERFDFESIRQGKAQLKQSGSRNFRSEIDTQDDAFITQ